MNSDTGCWKQSNHHLSALARDVSSKSQLDSKTILRPRIVILFITRNWDYIVIGLVSASFSWITELFLNGHLEVLSSLVSCCYNYVLVNCVYFFLISGSNDVLVKLTVSARELSKEQQEKIDEILQLHVQLYTENHKLSSPNGVRAFVQHITRAYNLAVESVEMGSLIITVKCPTLESLERLWSDYQSGCLDDIAEIFLLTTDIKSKLDLDIVRFKITIDWRRKLLGF